MSTRKKVAIFVFVTVMGLLLSWFVCVFPIFHGYVPHLMYVASITNEYIRSTGDFPQRINDFEEHGFIKPEKTPDGNYYFGRSDLQDDKHWARLYDFERIHLAYGTVFEDLEISDGKLFRKGTDIQVLLIDGPYRLYLTPLYKKLTLRFYRLMLEARENERPGVALHRGRE